MTETAHKARRRTKKVGYVSKRPKHYKVDRVEHTITFRINDAEKKGLMILAIKEDRSPSKLMRKMLIDHLKNEHLLE